MESYKVFEAIKARNSLKGYVFTSASSQYNNQTPANVIDWKGYPFYHSLNKENQWLRIDFPISPVYIEKFLILTGTNRDPYHWLLEGSNDTVNFDTIYENDGIPLCEPWGKFDENNIGCTDNVNKSFDVTTPGYYTSIRLRQTGLDSQNNTYLVIAALEIIGRIHFYTPSNHIMHCFSVIHFHILFTAIFL